jgi:hypothetical protein
MALIRPRAVERSVLAGSAAFDRRVKAQWGLIACGAEAVPYALRMLESSDAE